ILDVRVGTDLDPVDVAAKERAIPNAGVIAECHVAEHDSRPGDVNLLAQHRRLAKVPVELILELGLEVDHFALRSRSMISFIAATSSLSFSRHEPCLSCTRCSGARCRKEQVASSQRRRAKRKSSRIRPWIRVKMSRSNSSMIRIEPSWR